MRFIVLVNARLLTTLGLLGGCSRCTSVAGQTSEGLKGQGEKTNEMPVDNMAKRPMK